MEINLDKIKTIHFVGIKGVAMTALAIYAKERGIAITGSDVPEVFPTDETLQKANIEVLQGFSLEHIVPHPDLVIYTGAHNGRKNIEVTAAAAASIPTLAHGKALGMFMGNKLQVAVSGSHGKTTTTAMIATILTFAGKDPSYAIGCGEIFGLGAPGHFGKGEIYVAEADEYATDPTSDVTPRFLWQHPDILVVTNIDYDHPDIYASLDDVQQAFLSLQEGQKGAKITVMNADDTASSILGRPDRKIFSFGHAPRGTVQVSQIRFEHGKTLFQLTTRKHISYACTLRVPGVHNVFNAIAAAAACFALGIDWDQITRGLELFAGTKRRFEHIGESRGMTMYDDYAHHPAEIVATLTAARGWYPKRRLIVIFQPHTYSRTHALLSEFAAAFAASDAAVITDIYASARETDRLGLTGESLPNEVKTYHPNVVYAKGKEAVKRYLLDNGQKGDVVIFMGAGDIFSWGREIVSELQ